MQGRLEKSDMKPDELYADAGFVNGKTILNSQANDILLEGPSSGRSQSFETYNAEDRPLDVADFKVEIEEENKTVTVFSCPTKQAPVAQARSSKTGNILVHFVAAVCSRCQLKERCPVKIGKTVATLTLETRNLMLVLLAIISIWKIPDIEKNVLFGLAQRQWLANLSEVMASENHHIGMKCVLDCS